MRIEIDVLAAFAAALMVPAASQAASVTEESGTIVYHGEGARGCGCP